MFRSLEVAVLKMKVQIAFGRFERISAFIKILMIMSQYEAFEILIHDNGNMTLGIVTD